MQDLGSIINFGLQDRVAIVSGGSRGIGRATAWLLSHAGAKVVVTYRHDENAAGLLVEQLQAKGLEAASCYFDLAAPETADAVVDQTVSRWGHVDILINNAVQWGPRLSKATPRRAAVSFQEWQALTRANIEGSYALIRAALPSMRQLTWGRIVNVSSTFGVDPGDAALDWYATAKAALHGLIRSLYRDAAHAGVLINAVMPGLTLTEYVNESFPEGTIALAASRSPLRRLATPEEIARVIVFLASNANTTITGEIIRASGGA